MSEEIEKIIDMMIDEKMGCKEYRNMAEEMEDEELKKMFNFMADQEHDHYRMLKEYISKYIKEDE